MQLNEKEIKERAPFLCTVHSDYLDYMHNTDCHVSLKYGRPYLGLAIRLNDHFYVVPLTSRTTYTREGRGKNKRSPLTTTFIKRGEKEIANLLHNNMFPVPENEIERVFIDPQKDIRLANEQRQIRKQWVEINMKSANVYRDRYDTQSRNYHFLVKICCDFKKLEDACLQWQMKRQ